MKCLCITAPFYTCDSFENYYFPLNLGYLATFLKNAGHEVSLFNTSPFTAEDIDSLINELDFDVVLISTLTQNKDSAIMVAKKIKNKNPNIIIILGGQYPSYMGEKLIKNPYIDIIVKNNPGKNIVKLINLLESNKIEKLNKIPNIIYKFKKKIITTNSNSSHIHLNKLPTIDYSVFKNKYLSNFLIFPIETSRGCPLNCEFCSITSYFNGFERRDPKKVVNDLKSIISKFQFDVNHKKRKLYFDFIDPTINFDKKHIIDVCKEIIKEELNIKFQCQGRIDFMDEEIVKYLKKAGCNLLYYGVQSGSKKIREKMGIFYSNKDVRRVVKYTKKQKLRMRLYWIIGYPSESLFDLLKTVLFSLELGQENITSIPVLFPGTRLYHKAIQNKIITNKFFEDNWLALYPNKIPIKILSAIRYLMMIQSEKFLGSLNNIIRLYLESRNFRRYSSAYVVKN